MQSSGTNPTGRNKGLRLCLVDLRPDALGSSWRKSLKPVVIILSSLLPIDPAKAKCTLKGFCVRDCWMLGSSLCETEPYARRFGAVLLKPSFPLRMRFHCEG